jgi:hypothetical protein
MDLHFPIPPLIERHIGDAAFYWQQHDRSPHSPLINWKALAHFNRLLTAHLDGIRIARDTGWQLASQALNRWNGAGEVFVCSTLALEQNRDANDIVAAIQRKPERLRRALISALLWQPPDQSLERIAHWSRPEATELLQTVAWRALANYGEIPAGQTLIKAHFRTALQHPNPDIRAAACRASPCLRVPKEQIAACLDAGTNTIIAEAAIALHHMGNPQGLPQLQTLVTDMAAYARQLSGYYRQIAQQQLDRWLCELAIALPPGSPGIEELLLQLPPRQILQFILYHGDAAWLPWVQTQMVNPDCARHAGWVWSALTAIDLETNGLTLPLQDDEGARDYPTDDLDPGLPMPNQQAIADLNLPLPTGQKILLGQTIDKLDLPALLREAPQALRAIAARHLAQRTGITFNTRAPARQQAAAMEKLTHHA